jgi:signal peptidase II
MNRRPFFEGTTILLFSALILVLDQASKFAIRHYFSLHESRAVLGSFLRLTYVENPNMAFSLQFGHAVFLTVFGALASAAILALLIRLRHERFLTRLALALIFGGALGNLVDRFAWRGVVDFIEINFGARGLPVFNLADTAVAIGLVMLVLVVLIDKEPTLPETKLRETYARKAKPGTTDEERIWRNVR